MREGDGVRGGVWDGEGLRMSLQEEGMVDELRRRWWGGGKVIVGVLVSNAVLM